MTKTAIRGKWIVVTFLTVTGLLLISCSLGNNVKAEYVSPYDFSQLKNEDGHLTYGTESQSSLGIDVSDHQMHIDWHQVAADGIEFAMIRLGNRGYTEGHIYLDTRYKENISGAQQAGILVGVYFFSQAVNEEEAREEAYYVLEHLQDYNLDYPVAYDFEPVAEKKGRANSLNPNQLTKNARAFCEIIEAAGYDALVYGNKSDIGHYEESIREDYNIWFAEYNAATPSACFDFILWQYSNTGVVNGIETSVDMNIHFLVP